MVHQEQACPIADIAPVSSVISVCESACPETFITLHMTPVCGPLRAGVIAKLGLEARVDLLDAEMVGLDRANRGVELSDGSQLAYDLLLITSGLQVR